MSRSTTLVTSTVGIIIIELISQEVIQVSSNEDRLVCLILEGNVEARTAFGIFYATRVNISGGTT